MNTRACVWTQSLMHFSISLSTHRKPLLILYMPGNILEQMAENMFGNQAHIIFFKPGTQSTL